MTDKTHERVAVVAGVGPGLGAALVRKLAQEGCRVGMFARSPEFVSKLAAELGPALLAVPTDISDPKQVTAGFDKAREKLGKIIRSRREADQVERHAPHQCSPIRFSSKGQVFLFKFGQNKLIDG